MSMDKDVSEDRYSILKLRVRVWINAKLASQDWGEVSVRLELRLNYR